MLHTETYLPLRRLRYQLTYHSAPRRQQVSLHQDF